VQRTKLEPAGVLEPLSDDGISKSLIVVDPVDALTLLSEAVVLIEEVFKQRTAEVVRSSHLAMLDIRSHRDHIELFVGCQFSSVQFFPQIFRKLLICMISRDL